MKKILLTILINSFFYIGLQAQSNLRNINAFIDTVYCDTFNFESYNKSVLGDSIGSVSFGLYYTFQDVINQYESSLGFIKRDIPCDCFPCAAYCFEEVPKQPTYEDFKQYLLNY